MSTSCRILVFCPIFLPVIEPESIVNAKLFHALSREGYEIDVLTFKPWQTTKYSYGHLAGIWLKHFDGKFFMIEREPSSRVRKFLELLSFITTGNFIRGNYTWRKEFKLAAELHRKHPYQIVLYRGPGAMLYSATKFCKKFQLPLISNLNDPWLTWPRPYHDEGLCKIQHNFIVRLLQKSTMLTFPSQRLRDYYYKIAPELRNIDSAVIPHILQKEYQFEVKIDSDTFRIVYAGSLGHPRDAESFLVALRDFLQSDPLIPQKTVVEIIGLIPDRVRNLLKKFQIEKNVQILAPMEYETCQQALQTATILLLIEAPCQEGIFLPSKLIEYVQAGRPVLAVSPRNGVAKDLNAQYQFGEVADVNSPEEIREALTTLWRAFCENTLQKKYNASGLLQYFREEPLKQYRKIFNQYSKC